MRLLHISHTSSVTAFCIGALFAVLATTVCTQSHAQVDQSLVARIMDDPAIPATEKKEHLVKLGEEHVPALIEYLYKKPDSWTHIVPALGEIGDRRAAEPLHSLLDADGSKPLFVIRALGRIKDPASSELLLSMIGGPNTGAVISALAEISEPRAVEPILTLLRSENESVTMRIHYASELVKFASKDVRAEAGIFLMQNKYLHELHLQQEPEGHPYWRFPHEAWWNALATVNSNEAHATLARSMRQPLMVYDLGTLIRIVEKIETPSKEIIEALFWSAENNNPGEVHYSIMALEALLSYGQQVDSDRLHAAIEAVIATTEKWPSPENSEWASAIIGRLAKLQAEVPIPTSGFISRDPARGEESGDANRPELQQPDLPTNGASIRAALEEEADESAAAEAARSEESKEPEGSGWPRGMLVISICAVAFLLALAGYRVFSKKGRSES